MSDLNIFRRKAARRQRNLRAAPQPELTLHRITGSVAKRIGGEHLSEGVPAGLFNACGLPMDPNGQVQEPVLRSERAAGKNRHGSAKRKDVTLPFE
jgi:hypothetical protein